MITMKTFTDDRVLNIFTDASVLSNGNEFISSHGIYVPRDKLNRFSILRNSSNNIGELSGILDALVYALPLRNNYERIHIWTDSAYSMKCICEWFGSWYNNRQYGNLMNSKMQPVENQEIIVTIVRYILDNDFKVVIYHQRGHILENNNLHEAMRSFTVNNNGLTISEDAMKYAAACNNTIDEVTRQAFTSMNTLSVPVYNEPIKHTLGNIDVQRLYMLTKKLDELK
jgi:ribonuclease HI